MIIPTVKTVANQVINNSCKYLKVLMLALIVPGGTLLASDFQELESNIVLQEQEDDQDKERRVEIDREDLPHRIQDALLTYDAHTYVQSYKYVDEDGNVTQYEVRLQRQDNLDMKLVYDKDGEVTEMIPDDEDDEKKKKGKQPKNNMKRKSAK